MKLLYIHGYNGNPYGNSYKNLKLACKNLHELHSIDYDENNPLKSIETIHKYIKENKIECVIGASLGGFITMNLYGVSRIVVNPCFNPAVELPKLGFDGNIKAYKNLYNRMINSLDFEEKHLCSGVFVENDELLGLKYLKDFKKYFKNYSIIKGKHHITRDMAQYIIGVILPMHDKYTTEFCEQLTLNNK